MTIAEQLEQTGVSLDDDVGYLYELREQAGIWRVENAKLARVLLDIPDRALGFKGDKDYDPENSLALQWVKEGKLELCIVRIRVDTKMDPIKDGGLTIELGQARVRVGQASDIIKTVCSFLRIQENMSREDILH